MKKWAVILALLLPGAANATTLANTSGVTPATDTIYTAVTKIDTEIDRIYTFINSLFKLQAAATCPAAGNSTYDVCLDTTPPLSLTYWDGNSWETLVNPTAYDSGLTFEASVKGKSENCVLEANVTAKTISIFATAVKPCTIESGGKLLQVTSTISEDYQAVGAGTYYVKPVRSATTFTLSHDAVDDGVTHYLGTITLSDTGVISGINNHEGLIGMFGVRQADGVAITNTMSQADYDVSFIGSSNDFNLATDTFMPTKRGWYNLNVTARADTAAFTQMCVAIYYNTTDTSTTPAAGNCVTADYTPSVNPRVAVHNVMLWFDGVDDYAIAANQLYPTAGTINYVSPQDYGAAFWGYWMGGAP